MTDITAQEFREAAAHSEWQNLTRLLLAAAEQREALDEADQRVQAMQKSVADCVETLNKVEAERDEARGQVATLTAEVERLKEEAFVTRWKW
jgi:peptidoglycan hydrolase CwlO-like protein